MVVHSKYLLLCNENLLKILETSRNLVDVLGKFYNWQCNFRTSGDFSTLYIGKSSGKH